MSLFLLTMRVQNGTFYDISTRTSLACNKLLLEQRKCTLDIKVKPV